MNGPWTGKEVARVALGFGLIVACYYGGVAIKQALHLILPGNVAGLFLMLIFLLTGVVKMAWIERASEVMLFILPMLFIPIYVFSGHDKALWREWGVVLLASLGAAVVTMWLAVAWVAGKFFKVKQGEPVKRAR